jgi:hypothetical protein
MVRFGWNRGPGVLAGLLAVVAGCYDWVTVRPTELPKLSAGASEVERVDGSRVHVEGPVIAKVLSSFDAKKFYAPRARIEGPMLTISGDDAPPTEFPLDEIREVRVGQLNVIDTTASAIVLGAVVVGSILLFLFLKPDGMQGGIK